MRPEAELAAFVQSTDALEVPEEIEKTAKQVTLTVFGTALAGAKEDGVDELRALLTRRGGTPEATSWFFGDHLPAANAAFLNGAMARALDYCDAMKPGLHLGSSVIPAALAASESVGGCSGREFLSAIIVGLEVGARFNLEESQYDGFDPTGVAGVMGATAAAARVFKLSENQTHHALALAFNKCGGSFQSNIDGSLAVRLIQGWVAQAAVDCVELARAGFTGPRYFLTGTYGFMKLFARDTGDPAEVVAGLGEEFRLKDIVFKKYPSCGVTQSVTELALAAVSNIDASRAEIDKVTVYLPPYAYRLVGHQFQLGETPRVNAQFSAQYCVANALLRGESKLEHFTPDSITDFDLTALIHKVRIIEDHELDAVGHTAARVAIDYRNHLRWEREIDIAPGFPGNPLTAFEHQQRFQDCLQYATHDYSSEDGRLLVENVNTMEKLTDARLFAEHLSASCSVVQKAYS